MKSERHILSYVIIILTIILLMTGLGYFNYKNTSFNGLSRKTTYSSGRRIKYAGLNWYVVKDNGKYVTLILSSNAKTGIYGKNVSWKNSDINKYLNEEWIKYTEQKALKQELEHGALVLDSESRTYIRLIKFEEINENPIINESNTPYWTMSASGDKMWYALESGDLDYTSYNIESSTTISCYEGNEKNSVDDLAKYNKIISTKLTDTKIEPNSNEAIVSIDIKSESESCLKNYIVKDSLYSASGEKTTYISNWVEQKENDLLGIRPVITVKKK